MKICCAECSTPLGEISGRIRNDTEYICKRCLKKLKDKRGEAMFESLFGSLKGK